MSELATVLVGFFWLAMIVVTNGTVVGLLIEPSKRSMVGFGLSFLAIAYLPLMFMALQGAGGDLNLLSFFLAILVPGYTVVGLAGAFVLSWRSERKWQVIGKGVAGFGGGAVLSALFAAVLVSLSAPGVGALPLLAGLVVAYFGPQVCGVAILASERVRARAENL